MIDRRSRAERTTVSVRNDRTETFGARVRRLRIERAITLRDLASSVGVTAPFLSELEHGRRFPTDETLRALARGLRVPLRYLGDVRLTRDTCASLERDPELLRAVIEATKSARLRKLILDARARVGGKER